MRPREGLGLLVVIAVIGAAAFWLLSEPPTKGETRHIAGDGFASSPQSQPAKPALVDLLILLDVSESLTLSDIQSEAHIALRYIQNDDEVQAGSTFRVAIADQDVERNQLDAGDKPARERYAQDRDNQERRWAGRGRRLSEAVTTYVTEHPDRKHTCILETMNRLPDMFDHRPTTMRRRVVFISDMVEDCANHGDPKTREAMRARLMQSSKRTPLRPLENIELFAIVPKGSSKVAIDWVRQPWQELLKEAGVLRARIGPPETFLGKL